MGKIKEVEARLYVTVRFEDDGKRELNDQAADAVHSALPAHWACGAIDFDIDAILDVDE